MFDKASKAERRRYLEILKAKRGGFQPLTILSEEESKVIRESFGELLQGYSAIRILSSGTYKKVVEMRNEEIGESLALKMVEIERIRGRALRYLAMRGYDDPKTAFIEEAERMRILKTLNNPNISDIVGSTLTNDWMFYLFLEKYSERTLGDYVEQNHPLGDKLVLKFMMELANALAGVHSVLQYHGDFRPENILFRNGTLKVTDFDLSSLMPDRFGETYRIPHSRTRAPELFRGHPLHKGADVWAYGVDIVYMKKGEMPFSHDFKGTNEEWRRLKLSKRDEYEQNVLRHIEDEKDYGSVMRYVDDQFIPPLAHIVKKCLARESDERFADGRELYDGLRNIIRRRLR